MPALRLMNGRKESSGGTSFFYSYLILFTGLGVQVRVLDSSNSDADFNLQPNLCYTMALDRPGEHIHRRMARILVTSLLRTGWHGRITIFRNGPQPVLPEAHAGVQEVVIDADTSRGWNETIRWKYRVRDWLDLTDISKILFLDCDCIALRSINHLMLGAWDIYTVREHGRIVEFPFNGFLTDAEMTAMKGMRGLNAGNIGVQASRFMEVMTEWERIDRSRPLRSEENFPTDPAKGYPKVQEMVIDADPTEEGIRR